MTLQVGVQIIREETRRDLWTKGIENTSNRNSRPTNLLNILGFQLKKGTQPAASQQQ